MNAVSRMARLTREMLVAERFGVELIVTISSVWAAWKMLSGPSNYAFCPNDYALLVHFQLREQGAGFFAAIAALLMTIGLSGTLLGSCLSCSTWFRCIGLAMGGVFWTVLGVSFVFGNPDSVAGVPFILMGISSWWTLIRFPSVPGLPDASRG